MPSEYNQNENPIPGPLYKVFTKGTWTTEGWTENTDLILVDLRDGANQITEARFLYHSGNILKRGSAAFEVVAALTLETWRTKFIKIEVYQRDEAGDAGLVIERWIVRVERIDNQIISPTAVDQTLFCYGLERALDNKIVTGSWVFGNSPAGVATDKASRKFYWLPGIPMRFNEPKFGTVNGVQNQDADYPSTTAASVSLYNIDTGAAQTLATAYDATAIRLAAFAVEKDSTRHFWTIGEALQYLITFYSPDLTNETFYPKNTEGLFKLDALDIIREAIGHAESMMFLLGGDFDEDGSGNRTGVRCPPFSPEGRSLFECLNFLLRPERGLGWKLIYDDNANNGSRGPKIVLFSITTRGTLIGDSVYAPSSRTQDMNLTGRFDVEDVRVLYTDDNNYGFVIARGEPILSCFSISYAEGSLDKAWTSADETDYNNPPDAPPSGTDGYWDKIEDARQHIKAYVEYEIKDSWNWKAKNGENAGTAYCVNPPGVDNTTGAMPDPSTEHNISRARRHLRFESFIPIEEAHQDHTDEDLVPEYMRPKLFIKWTDSYGELGWYDLGTTNTPNAPRATISTLPDKLGFRIEASPRHRLAVTPPSNRDPAEDFQQSPWTTLVITAAMRTSQRLSRAWQITGGDKHKVLWIDVPNAELWLIAPNTPYKVNASRQLVRTDSDVAKRVVRNDAARLGEIVGTAGLWYSQPHRDVQVLFSSLPFAFLVDDIPNWEVGVVIENLAWGAMSLQVNTVVSGRYFDFLKNKSVYSTGFGQPNFSVLA